MAHEGIESVAVPGDLVIEPRLGVRVFVNQRGEISLSQLDEMGNETIIVLHPEEARELAQKLPEFIDENFAPAG